MSQSQSINGFIRLKTFSAVCGLALLLASGSLPAQLPIASLNTLNPAGAKQGTELEVTVGGGDLDNISQLVFSHPGITATAKTTPAGEFDAAPQTVANVFLVKVDAAVPAGVYDARVAGDFGVSNPRRFVVGTQQEVTDNGGNRSLETAQLVELGSTVTGVSDGANRDYYKFAAAEGQRIVISVDGQTIDSRIDASMVLYDSAGKEMKNNRDASGLDPLIDYTFSTAGEYTVAIYDSVYRGGAEYHYRLTITAGAYVDFVFPPVGTIGSNNEYKIFGRNLAGGQPVEDQVADGAVLQQVAATIAIPAAEALAGQLSLRSLPSSIWDSSITYRHEGANLVYISTTELPVSVEKEGNNDAASATVLEVPSVVAGQFFPAGDEDWYQFSAKKGEIFQLEVVSQQVGVLSDAVMLVQRVTINEAGEETVAEVARIDDPGDRNGRIGGDFDTSTDDPNYRLVVADDGLYRVLVYDQLSGNRNDPRQIYQLRIRPEKPDFRIIAQPAQVKVANANEIKMFSPAVRRGGTLLVNVRIEKLEGFAGDIQLAVEGLPEGVSCDGAMIGSQGTASLVFVATDNAANWTGAIKIVGTADINGEQVQRTARHLSVVWPTGNKTLIAAYYRTTPELWLAVIGNEDDPAMVQVGDGQVLETSKGGTLEVPITVTRREGLTGDMKFVATGLPNEVKPGDVTIKGDTGEGKLTMAITNNNAKPGVYTYYLRCDTKVKRPRNVRAIAEAEASLARLTELKTQLDLQVTAATEKRDKAEGDDKVKAEEELKQIQEKTARAEEARKAAEKKVADVKKANEPKDVNIAVISSPIRVRIVATPLTVKPNADEAAVKAAETVQVAVTIERKYGFAEDVELTATLPGGVAGITVATITIPKDQAEGTLEFVTTDKATVGDHQVTLQVKGIFNKINVTADGQLKLKVEPVAGS
jgi:hypothetical protein